MKKLKFISVLVVIIGTYFTVSAFAEFYVISVNNKCGPCNGMRSTGGRWCDNGDGTITDMTTCLVWLKYADWGGYKTWEDCTTHNDANTRASILSSGETIFESGETVIKLEDDSDLGDWRLPTKTELESIIIEGGETVCASNMQLFEGVQSSVYWSYTSSALVTSFAYGVSMTTGGHSGASKTLNRYVWPVRNLK